MCGTTTTGIRRQGHQLHEIANVTHHKNIESLLLSKYLST